MTPSDLCVACGMCCDGTMFGNVVAHDHELVQMIFLGAETKSNSDSSRHFFLQPCPAHVNGSCSIYETRPLICKIEDSCDYFGHDKTEYYNVNIEGCHHLIDKFKLGDEWKPEFI